jgi:gamma-glutamylcyclotransferase (GGCT)/AIG2-like uncharacterized protein YtfP
VRRLQDRVDLLSRDSAEWLFVYGTLLPDSEAPIDESIWRADAVRGRLYDLGPFPGLVDLDDLLASWVNGYRRKVERDLLATCIDEYEGVGDGLFRRIETTTRAGHRAWVYVYNRALADGARGPLNAWDGPRGAWPSG